MDRDELRGRARRAAQRTRDGAGRAARKSWRFAKWVYQDSGLFYKNPDGGFHVGPSEPIDMQPGESPSEHLRRKHNERMGANYGPHDDLEDQAYVRDRDGNLRPYDP